MPFHSMFLILTFKQLGWYLNLTTQFMKNVLTGEWKRGGGRANLWNKWHIEEIKQELCDMY